MKKLLATTTALALVGSGAVAEMAITVGGSAELGFDYNSDPITEAGAADVTTSKHSFVHDFGVTFGGSGTTDGGLSFGATAGIDSKTGGGSNDEGKVWVSGSFGTLTIGDQDAADVLAGGISDVGMNGIGVDDVAEGVRGQTAHQFRYDNSFGQIKVAISAGTKAGTAGTPEVVAVPGIWVGTNRTSREVGVTVVNQSPMAAFDEILQHIALLEDTPAEAFLPEDDTDATNDPSDLFGTGGLAASNWVITSDTGRGRD